MQKNYRGLINEGATCYLNSLLQTLFMTYEFRKNVYSYSHNPKKIKETDSIPYQLQKLFIRLQNSQYAVSTRDLLKSFQWTAHDSFEQHDVQQFCRKLFEAVEKAHKNSTWIGDLFSGSMGIFKNCGKHRTVRSQTYLDISLPIRNIYKKESFNSLEQCIKEYLRPQKIDDKIECEECGEKVFVTRGSQFESIPPIFTLQLNRFELNYENFQRQKLNNFVYFPEILEMHRFMKPFDQIEIKQLPQDLKKKAVKIQKEKSARTMNFYDVQPVQKLKKKNSDDIEVKKQNVTFLDEEGKEKRQKQVKQFTSQEEKQRNKAILAGLKSQMGSFDKNFEKLEKKKEKTKQEKKDHLDLDNDMLFGDFGNKVTFKDFRIGGKSQTPLNVVGQKPEKPIFEKTQTLYQHQEEIFDRNKQYPDFTYALYAVLVHSGGAYGGHYYAYISDGTNWYKFDDTKVLPVSRGQMRKYGENINLNWGASAYLLFYRDTKTFKDLKEIEIPQQIAERIEKEEESKPEPQQNHGLSGREIRMLQLNEKVLVKVFINQTQFFLIKVEMKTKEILRYIVEKIKQELKIVQKDENWRIRRYNKSQNTMHEIYGPELYQETLDAIGFREQVYLTVEYKKDEQNFEQYDPKSIIIKVYPWVSGVIMVSDKKLNPIKIQLSEDGTFEQFYKQLQRKSGINEPLILKRTYSIGNPVDILSLEESKEKKLIEIRFFNGINLYTEEKTERIKWLDEFESERHRCEFKFNNPKIGQEKNEEIYFDTRKTLGELKAKIAEVIDIPEDSFRVKRAKQSVSEMTTYKKKLSDLRFIRSQMLYIEEGKSSKGSIIIRRGQVALIDDKIQFNLFDESQFDITADVQTVQDIVDLLGVKYGLLSEQIRVRQYKNFEFKEIFQKTDQIQRIKQKSLVWQKVESEQRGFQIYFRVWNIMTFEFGPLGELFIDPIGSYSELASLIQQETTIPGDKILVYKPLSMYVDKETMLDCDWIELMYLPDSIKEEPLQVVLDGDIIIIQEAVEAYKPKPIKKKTTVGVKSKGKEAGLTITVVEENQGNQGEEVKQEENKAEQKKEQQKDNQNKQKQEKL